MGLETSASDPFTVDLHVFTNLGQLVGKAGFSLAQSEFEKLPLGQGDSTRTLTILWGNRSG